MKLNSEHEAELKSYLLGELSQEEHERVEARLFVESDYLEELKATEDDLIDDYIYEDLSTSERVKFEEHFLSTPQHREDLRIARALKQYIVAEAKPETAVVAPDRLEKPPAKFFFLPLPRSPLARLSLAALVLIALVGIVWLIVGTMRRQNQSKPQEARQPTPQTTEEQPRVVRDAPSGNLPQPGPDVQQTQTPKKDVVAAGPSPSPPPNRASSGGLSIGFLLSPGGLVRGGQGSDINKVRLPSNVSHVVLRLPLIYTNKYRTYFATLQTETGAVRAWKALKPTNGETGKEIWLKMPAKTLQPQIYSIKLGGMDANNEARDISVYTFTVEREAGNSGN